MRIGVFMLSMILISVNVLNILNINLQDLIGFIGLMLSKNIFEREKNLLIFSNKEALD